MGNTIPNKVDGTLKFETEIAQESQNKVGKHPILAKDVTTIDVPTSDVIEDWETRNNKAQTVRRSDVYISFDIAADMDLLGKVVADLQKDVAESTGNVVGTLNYVEDYTGFSGDPEEQEGHYLAFKVGYNGGAYTKITAQGGTAPEVEVDPNDHTHILIIKKKAPIVLRAYNGDVVVSSKTFDISQLVLKPAEND